MIPVEEYSFAGGQNKLHKEWKFSLEGVTFILQRYGTFCAWSRIALRRDQEEVYFITLEGETRREFFFQEQAREYIGNKFSFVEYLQVLLQNGRLPTCNELHALHLEEAVAYLYDNYGQRIISQRAKLYKPPSQRT